MCVVSAISNYYMRPAGYLPLNPLNYVLPQPNQWDDETKKLGYPSSGAAT